MATRFPTFYPILDARLLGTDLESVAIDLACAGIGVMQYRDKNATSRACFRRCESLMRLLEDWEGRFIVNDRPDVARMVYAAGVHVGQDDLSVQETRAICTGDQWVGISTHNIEQFKMACETSADYIAVGPIFATRTKLRHEPPLGIDFIREVRGLTARPVVAIGGISTSRAAEVYRAGADCIAVAKDLLESADVAGRARQYMEIAAAELSST